MYSPIYGLIGEKLSHSFSPFIHSRIADYDYQLFERPEAELEEFFQAENFGGVNITLPYKKTVMQYCDVISDAARRIGCVNVVVKKRGKLYGDNTDYHGLKMLIAGKSVQLSGKKVVILGTGATSQTAQTLCEDEGAQSIVKISRSGDNSYENIEKFADYDIMINTTPCGMYPNNLECKVDLSIFRQLSGVFDVVYNPLKTALILQAEEMGITCAGGLSMLLHQAVKASEIFTGNAVSKKNTQRVLGELYAQNLNIVLIGMPGSGKSSLARKVGSLTGKLVVDIDAKIVEEVGMDIPQIFQQKGETFFRDKEAEVIEKYSKQHNLVIATGGGSILRERNVNALRQNGMTFWIKRDISRLSTRGRPLSKDLDSVKQLYAQRVGLYEKSADAVIFNNGHFGKSCNAIVDKYNSYIRCID